MSTPDQPTPENPYEPSAVQAAPPDVPDSGDVADVTIRELLFSFQGRIHRTQYWIAQGLVIAAVLVFAFIAGVSITLLDAAGTGGLELFLLAYVPFIVLMTWVGLAVGIKRYHDRGKSGWWVLIGVIPYVGGLIVLVECGFLEGDNRRNPYGPIPGDTIWRFS